MMRLGPLESEAAQTSGNPPTIESLSAELAQLRAEFAQMRRDLDELKRNTRRQSDPRLSAVTDG